MNPQEWRCLRWLAAAGLGAALLIGTHQVRAQTSGEAKAAAEMLFREARQLMAVGKYAEACPKFADSQRLDPAVGTLLNLALCYKQNGQTASAWVTYRDAATEARKAGQTEREKLARAEVDALEPGLSRLVITLSPEAQAVSATIKVHGIPIPVGVIGAPMPVDPGEHLITAYALGKREWSTRVKVEGTTPIAVLIPALSDAPASVQGPAGPSSGLPLAAQAGQTGDRSRADGNTQRLAAVGVAGVGLAAIVVGSVLGLAAKSAYDDASRFCRPSGVCSPEGLARDESAHSKATSATIAFTVGVVAIGGGVALWFTAPRPAQANNLEGVRAGAQHVADMPPGSGLMWSGAW
jgi:serine/threonine-protein kinase